MTKTENFKNTATLSLAGLVLVLVAGLAVWWFMFANVVARVNGEAISKDAYTTSLDAQKKYQFEYQKMEQTDEAVAKAEENVLDDLIESEVVMQEASERGLEVTDEEVDEEFNNIAEANGGVDEFTKQIDNYYGFTVDEYKEYKVKPILCAEKLEVDVLGDEKYGKSAKEEADKALAELKDGKKFSEVVNSYSDDELSKAKDGDMGWIGKGETVKEFEDAVFAIKKGQMSEVFKTIYGYHIVKVTDTKTGQVRVSQVLVKVDSFQEWLDKKVEEADVKKY